MKKLVASLVLAGISFVFAIGCLELVAMTGLVDYRLVFKTLGDEPWRNPLNRLDPELLHLHQPRQRSQGVQPNGDIGFYMQVAKPNPMPFDVQYDANGFRNAKDLEQADIVVLGDSFIEAPTVMQDQMLTTRLQQLTGVTVANLGQIWYGPQQELAVLKRFTLALKPKVVVWSFFGGNDLSDFRRYEAAKSSWETTSPTFHSFLQRSFSKNAVKIALGLVRKQPAREPAPAGECPLAGGKPGEMYFYYGEKAIDEATLTKALATLREAELLVRAAGAKFVVAYVPTKFQVYGDLCKFPAGSKPADWKPAGLAARLERELGAALLDLTPALREAARVGRQTYFIDDTHWTVDGNAVAAEALKARISGL